MLKKLDEPRDIETDILGIFSPFAHSQMPFKHSSERFPSTISTFGLSKDFKREITWLLLNQAIRRSNSHLLLHF